MRPASRGGLAGVVATVALAALVGGLAGGLVGAARTPSTPGEESVEAGFARDMQVHHQQAVQVALLLGDRTRDPVLRTLADDIATGQQHQSGQMYGWLAAWGLRPTGTQPPMRWMAAWVAAEGHRSHGPRTADPLTMPGMASAEDVAALAAADGAEAELLFLRLMIAHHEGGVAMAEAAADLAGRPEVTRLATAMSVTQSAEIASMEELLRRRTGPG